MAFFITIEGGDGSGKSTLLNRIQTYLDRMSLKYVCTREPGGTKIGEEIRATLLKPGRTLDAMTELLLYEAARAEHVAEVIRPALQAGKHVICDRFTHSTVAYQGYGRNLGRKVVDEMNRLATGGLEPDLIIWLKVPPQDAQKRVDLRGEKNRLDHEKIDYHQKVFQAFTEMAEAEADRFIILDGTEPKDKVFATLESNPKWRRLFL
jgi:dTMP kinase